MLLRAWYPDQACQAGCQDPWPQIFQDQAEQDHEEAEDVDEEEEEVFWLVLAAITNLGVMAKQIGKYFIQKYTNYILHYI